MNYRVLEHPEGNFIPQLSKDGGISWESLICYKYDRVWKPSIISGVVTCWGKAKKKEALETIENHKRMLRELDVTRVVYQE